MNNGRRAKDPKIGLLYEGPFDSDLGPDSIGVGVVGSKRTIELIRDFLSECAEGISSSDDIGHKPPFPAFKKSEKWNCEFKSDNTWTRLITEREIESLLEEDNIEEGIGRSAELISRKIEGLKELQNSPDVVIVGTPEKLNQKFGVGADIRGKSYLEDREELKKQENSGQENLAKFKQGMEDPPRAWDLRRALKISSMEMNMPIQLVNRDTLSNKKQRARKAWYLISALYYKAGGVPWRSTKRDPNTCYLGLSFYRELKEDESFRTSLAQLFTPKGQSIVLRGDRAVEEEGMLQLPEESAKELIDDSLSKYKDHTGTQPRRLVIHKKGKFSEGEISGIRSASKEIEILDLVGVSPSDIRLYRSGDYPVPRGTYLHKEDETHLYLTGYIPEIGTYPGNGVPKPSRLNLENTETNYQKICREMLELSKMSWNNASMSTRKPVTIEFTDKVGKILSEMNDKTKMKSDFRFYM